MIVRRRRVPGAEGGGGERVVAAVGVFPAGQQVECQRLRCAAVSAKACVSAEGFEAARAASAGRARQASGCLNLTQAFAANSAE